MLAAAKEFPIDYNLLEAEALQEAIAQFLNDACVTPFPFFIHMLGVPGVGKTTFAKSLYEALEEKCLYLGFDDVMGAIPDYQYMSDKKAAFEKWELPARNAGYHILKQALDEGYSILFDHGGSPPEHPLLFEYAKQRGYRCYLIRVKTSLEKAKARLHERNQLPDMRFTPPDYIDERLPQIERNAAAFASRADKVFEIENDSDRSIDVLYKDMVSIRDEIEKG